VAPLTPILTLWTQAYQAAHSRSYQCGSSARCRCSRLLWLRSHFVRASRSSCEVGQSANSASSPLSPDLAARKKFVMRQSLSPTYSYLLAVGRPSSTPSAPANGSK